VRSPSFAALGAWIEQLVAESTGKNGQVILPIDGEPLSKPSNYGNDRAFVYVRDASTTDALTPQIAALAAAGCPTLTVEASAPAALAGEFFRWDFATAVAASILGVNPFDQPDVEASKVATRALTDAAERGSAPPQSFPEEQSLHDMLASIKPGDYVALLAFLPMFPEIVAALHRTRSRIRDARRVATSVGFGPRYLHSTGQAFKGGPNTGVFVQLTCDAPDDLAIPGRKVTFGNVVAAQAAGDLQVLRERGRRVAHVHLRGDLTRALADFDAAVGAALA
jgi:transaldolase/glucose-6-phosphate isomerase